VLVKPQWYSVTIILGFHSRDFDSHVGVQNNGKMSLKLCLDIYDYACDCDFFLVGFSGFVKT